MIAATMSGVREQAKATEEEIHFTIEKLISLLRDREVVLINDVETIKHQKEKELQLQKDEIPAGWDSPCCVVQRGDDERRKQH